MTFISKHLWDISRGKAFEDSMSRVPRMDELRSEVLQRILWVLVLVGAFPAAFGAYSELVDSDGVPIRGLLYFLVWIAGLIIAAASFPFRLRALLVLLLMLLS